MGDITILTVASEQATVECVMHRAKLFARLVFSDFYPVTVLGNCDLTNLIQGRAIQQLGDFCL